MDKKYRRVDYKRDETLSKKTSEEMNGRVCEKSQPNMVLRTELEHADNPEQAI